MSIIENVKDAVKLAQQVNNLELYRKLVDLQGETLELTERMKQKDETISQLKDALSLKGKLVCKDSAYYLTDDKGEVIDGPFCTKCFDVDYNKCRLVRDTQSLIRTLVQCQKCKLKFISNYAYEFLGKRVQK